MKTDFALILWLLIILIKKSFVGLAMAHGNAACQVCTGDYGNAYANVFMLLLTFPEDLIPLARHKKTIVQAKRRHKASCQMT